MVFLLGNQNLFHLHSEADHHTHEHAINHHCEDFPANHQHLEENCIVCEYSTIQAVELLKPAQFEFELFGVSFLAELQQSYSFDFYQIIKNKSPPIFI